MPPVDLLFVYGALLAPIDHPMGRRLRREADLLGPATIRGRLYRVSWYPGLVDGAEDDVAAGELYRLRDPASALEWLDEFEGVSRGGGSVTGPDEYERVVRTVVAGVEVEAQAWVYVYRGSVRGLERHAGGAWRG